jgi:UDP-N-acetylglucosamine--N-acetylmuramyl-(pentapeptide) pyrophosphoryl-undecaprenol N-acetylglucosamine transferase
MPGAATAEALAALVPGARSMFLTGGRDSERRCHAALAGFETARAVSTRWRGARHKLLFPWRALLAALRVLKVLRTFRPHVVVGLGGSDCFVPLVTARLCGVKTVLFEGNAAPGRAVRALAPLADLVVAQWPVTTRRLRARRVLVAGNPVRRRLLATGRREASARLGLAPGKRTLLAMGGSQGALALNEALWAAMEMLQAAGAGLQVVHLTGPDHLAAALEMRRRLGALYRPIGFLDRMEDAYAAADLVVSRAGASSLAQLTALGLPPILVPLPQADGHQAANARVLQDAAAAMTIPQSELTPIRLAKAVRRLADDESLRAQMARNARALGRPEAALTVASELAALAGFAGQAAPPAEEGGTHPGHASRAA